jgi:NNP family nitrate/nitrite transporter-like MFS transporter
VSSTLGVYAMLPLYLVSERHIDQSWANVVLALSRSYGPVLALLGGWVSDRLGPKRTIVIALNLTGATTFLLGPAADSWISLAVFLQPLVAVWFFPAAFAALAAITSPAGRNLAVSFTIPFGYVIGGGVVPTFIGIMGDAGTFAAGFVVTGGLILSGGLLALLLKIPENNAQIA